MSSMASVLLLRLLLWAWEAASPSPTFGFSSLVLMDVSMLPIFSNTLLPDTSPLSLSGVGVGSTLFAVLLSVGSR